MKYRVSCVVCGARFTTSEIKYKGELENKGYSKPHCCIACSSELIKYREVK